jgi:hypothetical protein
VAKGNYPVKSSLRPQKPKPGNSGASLPSSREAL